MVFNDGILSNIEATYLEEPTNSRIGNCGILINPGEVSYIINKTIIINRPDYPLENIYKLLERRNHIISRIQLGDKSLVGRIHFEPYIMRVNYSLCWNGDVLSYPGGDDVVGWLEDGQLDSMPDTDKVVLYFPKLLNLPESVLMDGLGNLTSLGWAEHQVGINLGKTYLDMDLLKTNKVIL